MIKIQSCREPIFYQHILKVATEQNTKNNGTSTTVSKSTKRKPQQDESGECMADKIPNKSRMIEKSKKSWMHYQFPRYQSENSTLQVYYFVEKEGSFLIFAGFIYLYTCLLATYFTYFFFGFKNEHVCFSSFIVLFVT
jgi:hypothetical protein